MELDPRYKAHYESESQIQEEPVEQLENTEAGAREVAVEDDPRDLEKTFPKNWAHNIPVIGQIKRAGELASLGVADFAFDAIGLVPGLKRADEWWDNNSPRSQHPAHKLIRDASSVIIPSMLGGGAVVGYAKGATQAMKLPKYAKTLGAVLAYTGVDTSVSMISSHSKKDDNIAATLNDWLGWGIPWATRSSDSPDVRWKKNVLENAGLSAGVELLGAAFTFAKKYKVFPRDIEAKNQFLAKRKELTNFNDPAEAAVKPRQMAREAAQNQEMIEAIKSDPDVTSYNPFIHDLGEDTAGRAVTDLQPDPLLAKLNHAQIQNNVDSLNGRAAPIVDSNFLKSYKQAINSNERAKHLDAVFDAISPNFDAVVGNTRITAEQMNRSVDNLTQAIYGKDLSFKEFEFIVDDMKTQIFNSNEFLSEENWVIASQAFKNAYDTLFDPNQMRASGLLVQQTADGIADAATAARMLGDEVDSSRQMKVIFDKLDLLGQEVAANNFIMQKAHEYKQLIKGGNLEDVVSWMNMQADNFDEFLNNYRAKSTGITAELQRIAKENPSYYEPFKMAYDATNGNVDTLHKLHVWTEHHIGLIKKAFIDGEPEVPSYIIKGLQGARINGVLSGLSAARAAVGNSVMTALKPISVFAGAAVQGDIDVMRRAMYTYGGFTENIKRGFKVMSQEWKLANLHPEEAAMRGRVDLRASKLENMEILDKMAAGWAREGEFGKVAMWNIAKGLTWWNKQNYVKYGTNALYAIDGFTNSFMASGMARAKAYDKLLTESRGSIVKEDFLKMQRDLYSEAFDDKGLLTDTAAKFAASEIALNLDNAVVRNFEKFMDHVPAAKGLFMFPRTGVNGFNLAWSFNPLSSLGPAMTRARKVLAANTKQAKIQALVEHGIDASQDPDLAFNTLKSEYIGRQIMGSTVVMGAGMWAVEGNLTGNGPQNDAERRRMMAMGWQPNSIKNPITGDWHSYKGFEPFDKLLGLTADAVYQANRVDQAITEDWFRKLGHSITMNITNDTFLQGFEPLVGLISGDPSAWNRFIALQADMTLVPYKGVRTILNKAITPQLKDVENDIGAYLMNANKFLFRGDDYLHDMLDIYTGKPIRYYEGITRAANALLPTFQQNGDMEPWRQWLLSTGWDGLQNPRRNKITGQPLSPDERQYINNWIAQNASLKSQIIDLMTEGDGYWKKKLKEYVKARGLKKQSQYPIKEFLLHKELDRIHNQAFNAAWDSLEARNENFTDIGIETRYMNLELNRGNTESAAKHSKNIRDIQNIRK